jgi:phosphohistidine phosphatase SixA
MRSLELRRHAQRDPNDDRLSDDGRALAEKVAATLTGDYDVVFVSPAARAAETAEIFAPGAGRTVVEGLASDAGPEGLADVVRDLVALLSDGGRGLAVGHTPLIEKAVQGLTGNRINPLAECEGVVIVEETGSFTVEELRLD